MPPRPLAPPVSIQNSDMGEKVGRVKKILGNVTEDRDVEAEGRAEESLGHKPDSERVDVVKDEIQTARGEKHQTDRTDEAP